MRASLSFTRARNRLSLRRGGLTLPWPPKRCRSAALSLKTLPAGTTPWSASRRQPARWRGSGEGGGGAGGRVGGLSRAFLVRAAATPLSASHQRVPHRGVVLLEELRRVGRVRLNVRAGVFIVRGETFQERRAAARDVFARARHRPRRARRGGGQAGGGGRAEQVPRLVVRRDAAGDLVGRGGRRREERSVRAPPARPPAPSLPTPGPSCTWTSRRRQTGRR